jgi:hypothetical protein
VGAFAANITAIAATITALGGLVVVLTVFLPMLRLTKHTNHLVNQQQTDLRNYQRALIEALKRAGVEIPADQSRTNGPGGNT